MFQADLTIIADRDFPKIFAVLKKFDANTMLGPTLSTLRAREPMRIDMRDAGALYVLTKLLRLLDDLAEIGINYQLVIYDGPPEIVDGKPVWTPRDASRDDIAAIVETETKRNTEREAALASRVAHKPPKLPTSLEVLRKRWQDLEYSCLLPSEIDYIHLWWLKVEVENGTFDQYFFNSAGDHANEVLDALKRLDADQTASILADAIDAFVPVGGYTSNRSLRQERMQSLAEDAFEVMTNQFYECEEDVGSLALGIVESEYRELGLLSEERQ